MSSFLDGIRYFRQKCLTFGHYPSSAQSALIFLTLYVTFGFDVFKIEEYVPSTFSLSEEVDFSRRLEAGIVYWLILCLLRKFVLRQLFSYRAWMYEGSKPSLKTKLFVIAVRALCGWSKPLSKSLYDVQGVLPALPIPNVQQTVTKHLQSMKPLLEPSKYAQLEKKAKEFMHGPASKLQSILKLKWWFSPNYISDWWEEYVYLMSRSPLLIDSNYWFVDAIPKSTPNQAARAALVTWKALEIRREIDDGTFETLMPQGLIPVCNWQYSRMFNTTRVPGETVDYIRHNVTSEHIIVLHQGRYFKLNIYHESTRKPLNAAEWQLQYRRILADSSQAVRGEDKLAALTSWDRTSWAKARNTYLAHGINKISLEAIESSAFFLHLSDDDHNPESVEQAAKSSAGLEKLGHTAAHGDGCSRWLDKSLNFVIGKNGWAGGCCEHSWGDAMVCSHMWEVNLKYCINYDKYDANGCVSIPVVTEPRDPERMIWIIPEDCLDEIEMAEKRALVAIDDLDLTVEVFSEFGKDRMKKCRVSPDAFIQMVIQLAYYRNQGHFDMTYEPCMTRLYLQGRTETIRSCTEESCKWVLSMESESPRDLQQQLFRTACDKHQMNYREAMNGKGSDRHLFGLYIVSKYLKVDCPFLEQALGSSWRLSTSQLPIHQTKLKSLHSPAGGFGPVDKTGYGVAYIISGDDVVFFNINSNKSCPTTDSKALAKEVRNAMLDVRQLFFP